MQTETRILSPGKTIYISEINAVAEFLYRNLDEYGDDLSAIVKAIEYAVSEDSPGGYVIQLLQGNEIVSAAVINKTGMKEYIPENIIVYIATHKDKRGKGLGKELMQMIINKVEGDIALHVESQNPARKLYERFGFVNKYLEMRLTKI